MGGPRGSRNGSFRPAVLSAPASLHAVPVPLPPSVDATVNVDVLVQPQFLVNEAGAPDGTTPSYDLFLRRARFAINGNITKHFSYYFQIDDPNFGKYGNNTGRVVVQDAWVGWAPTGIEGGTVSTSTRGSCTSPSRATS